VVISSTASYVYVSGPLQSADDLAAARRLYERIACVCQELGWDTYLPHQQTDPIAHADVPPASVFKRDYYRVRHAALIIAHVGPPSSGVGAELGIALENDIPVIGVCHVDERPSRFITGMLDSVNLPMVVFDSVADCAAKLAETLKSNDALCDRPHRDQVRGQAVSRGSG
jgi:nucleoside 2-deoxyribosyltransferase